ncbi:MAG: hypothetical protein AAB433_06180 [Nitrospirota bacterium]
MANTPLSITVGVLACVFLVAQSGCKGFDQKLLEGKKTVHQIYPCMTTRFETTGKQMPVWFYNDSDAILQGSFPENCSKGEKPHGTLLVQYLDRDRSVGAGYAWFIPSLLTLTIINFFGVPAASQNATTDLQVIVQEPNNREIARYSGRGDNTEYTAYYWGYPALGALNLNIYNDIARAANAGAVLQAIEQVHAQIQQDEARLRAGLGWAKSHAP